MYCINLTLGALKSAKCKFTLGHSELFPSLTSALKCMAAYRWSVQLLYFDATITLSYASENKTVWNYKRRCCVCLHIQTDEQLHLGLGLLKLLLMLRHWTPSSEMVWTDFINLFVGAMWIITSQSLYVLLIYLSHSPITYCRTSNLNRAVIRMA
jgi:hypothetical protein